MGEQAIVLQHPDQNTVSLIFSWLSQSDENDQDAEGDYLIIFPEEDSHPAPRVQLGGAASNLNLRPVFWRTRQVQQFLTSREVNNRYRAAQMQSERTQEQPTQLPEFSVELPSTNDPEDNGQWYLDSRSNSIQEDESQTDSEVYKSSDSSNSDSGTVKMMIANENCPADLTPVNEAEETVSSSTLTESSTSAEPDLLENPLLRAFILDLDDAEMTPMLQMVANMMTPMYFNEQEAEVVRHYMLHKIQTTINSIQQQMDQLNLEISESEMSTANASPDEDPDGSVGEDESSTPTDEMPSPPVLETPVIAPIVPLIPDTTCDEEEQSEELQVEMVVENEGVTEASMKVITQIMEVKSKRKRKTLIKKAQLNEQERAMVKYFEASLSFNKTSWWNCCSGGSRKSEIPY